MTHCDDAILGVSNGSLRWILSVDAWCDIFNLDFVLFEEALQGCRGFDVQPLGGGQLVAGLIVCIHGHISTTVFGRCAVA